MSKKVLAFGASNSRESINKRLAYYTAQQMSGVERNLLDLNDFEMPIYSIDREREDGIPDLAHQFQSYISAADAIIISFAEHNGSYTTAFKNIYDWVSRIEKNVWQNKPMLLLSTSPGGRGARTVLELAANKFKLKNTNEILDFSLPFFGKHFSEEEGIIDEALHQEYLEKLSRFESLL